MADITLKGPQLPFVLGGTGELTIRAGATAIDRPLPPMVDVVLDVETHASANKPLALGGPGSWTLSVEASAGMKIQAVWPTSAAAVKEYGLARHFSEHPDDVVLLLTVGADAAGKFAGRLRYAALTATTNLAAGGDLTFAYAKPYPRGTPLGKLLETFLGSVRLPASPHRAVESGEVIKFEYGGYLNFGAALGVGYEVKGTSSADIGRLRLSEHYRLSVVGKVGITAQVGGFFGVEIREALGLGGERIAGWTRVVVRKSRESEFTFAADASAQVTSELKGLPEAPHEFLGAVLGVNAKNWLNLLEQVRGFTDLDHLLARCDALAVDFLTTWLGKQLSPDSLNELAAAASAFAKKYDDIDTTVMTVFERCFDETGNPATGTPIADALQTLAHLPSWESLEGDIHPVLWKLTTELTGGDPLGWMAEKPVTDLQRQAARVLELGNAVAHADIRALMHLVKTRFGIDALFSELAKIRTVADLKEQAGKLLDGLIERLLGDDIKRLQDTELGRTIARLHEILNSVDTFEKTVYSTFTETAKHAYAFNLHAEYSRASADQALIDMAINTSKPEGLALLQAATSGDFRKALSSFQPDLVRLKTGRLTHNLVRKSALKINIVGWHSGWRYQGMERLILHTGQQIVTDDRGGLTVYTTADLTKDRDRKRNQERVSTNFMMRFLGESRGVVNPDRANLEYLMDTLTRMSARYDLTFEDSRTTFQELSYYLSFAKNFGLTADGVQPAALAALLPLQGADDFGPMTVSYDVRYQSSGLKKLFTGTLVEHAIRRTIREVILGSYLRVGGNLAKLAWAYWTRATREFFENSATKSFAAMSPKEFSVDPSPFAGIAAPPRVVLQGAQLEILNTLYLIENAFVRGFLTLEQLIRSGRKISPHELEDRLGDVGTALQLLDSFGESVNTTFAVFDSLLKEVGGADRDSSLRLESRVAGRQVTKVFLARPTAR
jgi:hypothetical protein